MEEFFYIISDFSVKWHLFLIFVKNIGE